MDVRTRLNVVESGVPDGPTMVLAHGFGCDQSMWSLMTPKLESDYRVVVFDHVGAGDSDVSSYDPDRYATLEGYADDVVELCADLGPDPVIFVGHSVSSMIGVLAARRAPELFASLVLIGPSPRYIDAPGYVGGFSRDDIEEMMSSIEDNYVNWAGTMAPVIVGNPDRPDLGRQLTTLFCRVDPRIARNFAAATFFADNRDDLRQVRVPTLVLQCSDDPIAPLEVGRFTHSEIPDSAFHQLDATGHCPNLSAPDETVDAIRSFLGRR